MNDIILDITKQLKEIRISKGASLDIVQDFTGIHKSVLSKYERGVKTPKLDTLDKWANALGRKVVVNLHQPLAESVEV